jgi:hypothetical protein
MGANRRLLARESLIPWRTATQFPFGFAAWIHQALSFASSPATTETVRALVGVRSSFLSTCNVPLQKAAPNKQKPSGTPTITAVRKAMLFRDMIC